MTITKHPYYRWLTKEIYHNKKHINDKTSGEYWDNYIDALKYARTQFRIMMKKGLI